MRDDPLQLIVTLLFGIIVIPLFIGITSAFLGLTDGVGAQVATGMSFAAIGGLAWWRIRSHGVALRTLLLGRLRWGEAVRLGILVGLALLGAQTLVGLIIASVAGRWLPEWQELAQEEQLQHLAELGPETPVWEWAALFVVIVLVAPAAEELFFRGYTYNALRTHWGAAIALITSSVIFAVLHVVKILFPTILVTGIILTYVYQRTGALLTSIVAHMVLNAIVLSVLVATYIGTPSA